MGEYTEVRLDQLVPNPDNPRETLGDLDELAASIDAIGVLQRLLVTPAGGDQWMVVDGHRRYWAMRSVDYNRPIPVEVRDMDRADRIAAAVAAGTFIRPISPIDQAKAFRALEELGLTRAEIERRTGCNQPMISVRLRLLELSPKQQLDVHEGRMTLHQAKLAVYELGRRAPDKAPRVRRTVKRPTETVCETCGQPIGPDRALGDTLPSPGRGALAEPISRAEALKLIEEHR
jgi:ParB/RepB/Spo0J family partition protein